MNNVDEEDVIQRIRDRIHLSEHEISHTTSSAYPGVCKGYDDAWNKKRFRKNLKIEVIMLTKTEMEFDLIGVDASIANALRRILLAEVPTMAVDKVFINTNTSLIQDEVLSHRLGLIPFQADPRLFEMKDFSDGAEPMPADTLEFELKVRCAKNPSAAPEATDPKELYLHHDVTSKDIKWVPIGSQSEIFTAENVGPYKEESYPNILIAKLRPGHEIDLKVHCVKGIGQDHAKFSPVATASYRLLPHIEIVKDVYDETAKELSECFPKGVINLVKEKRMVDGDMVKGKKAVVGNPRLDTCSREVLRHPHLKDLVKLSRKRDHFIFSVESTGALSPDILVKEALKVLMVKCDKFLDVLIAEKENQG